MSFQHTSFSFDWRAMPVANKDFGRTILDKHFSFHVHGGILITGVRRHRK